MRRFPRFHPALLVLTLAACTPSGRASHVDATAGHYLRVTTAQWNIHLDSPEAQRLLALIQADGIAVFRAQPGFIRYRLMRADSMTTVAVAEWASESLGLAGAEQYRAWMRRVGIMDRLTLETHAGAIVAGS